MTFFRLSIKWKFHHRNLPCYLSKSVKYAFFIFAFCFSLFFLLACEEKKSYVEPKANEVKVTSFSPSDEKPIRGRVNITVAFSSDVVGQEKVGEVEITPLMKISPQIEGTTKWISDSSFRFYPDKVLHGGVSYSFEVLPAGIRASGKTLVGERKFSFQTEPMKISSIDHHVRYTNFKKKEAVINIALAFSYPVDVDTFLSHLSAKLESHGTLHLSLKKKEDNGERIELETGKLFMSDKAKKLELSLKEKVNSLSDEMYLEPGIIGTQVVEGAKTLKLKNLNARQSGDFFTIQAYFSAHIDPETIKDYVKVKPEIDYRLQSGYKSLSIIGDFKPAERYDVTLLKGFRAQNGAQLDSDITRNVLIPDYEPKVKFSSPGFYLPRKGAGNIAIETVNMEKVHVRVMKMFVNNLVAFLHSDLGESSGNDYGYHQGGLSAEQLGKTLYEETFASQGKKNETIQTPIDITHYLKEKNKGVFLVEAKDPDSYWRKDSRWVLASDIGIVAKKGKNALSVFANSLKTLKPYANAKVTLFSQTNQEMASVRTDKDGKATIANLLELSKTFKPFIIVVEAGDDFSFLKFSNTLLSTVDFDVSGQESPEAWQYRSYLMSDRGVYRPDDKARFVALVRTASMDFPPKMPVTLEIHSPDMRLFKTFQTKLDDTGACEFLLDIPRWAMTGHYRATLKLATGDTLTAKAFQVEDFMPDTMKVTLSPSQQSYQPGEKAEVKVKGMMLYGPPAANRAVRLSYRLVNKTFKSKIFPAFTFRSTNRNFQSVTREMETRKLDEKGQARFSFELPKGIEPPSMVTSIVTGTVTNDGGRAVTNRTQAAIHAYPAYVGLKQIKEGYAEPGKPFDFEAVAVSSKDKPMSDRKLTISLYRIFWHTSLKKDDKGYYRYHSVKKEQLESEKQITSTDKPAKISVIPKQNGQYLLVATDEKGNAQTSLSFYASGWGYSPWSMSSPDKLFLELDKDTYAAGEDAKLLVRAPFSGKLILTVEREGILETKIITMKENTATVSVRVREAWTPNVYLSATLLRSTASLEEHAPARAFGVAPLFVRHDAHKLQLSMKSPSELLPKSSLGIELEANKPSEKARVVVFAVDEGILQLTGFASPDPLAYFFAKQKLDVDTHDFYSMLLPEVEGVGKKAKTGGDMEATGGVKELNPVAIKRVEPISLYSGFVRFDKKGKTAIRFDVPQFNGTLRVMAVAHDKGRFSAGEKKVIVADRIVLSPTLPRILAPKDKFTIPISLFNKTGKKGTFEVTIETNELIQLKTNRQTISLDNNSENLLTFEAKAADKAGKAEIRIFAKGNGSKTEQETTLAVRPPSPRVVESGAGAIEAGKRAKFTFPKGFMQGTVKATVVVSSLPAAKFTGSLQFLLSYPHGCIEQTTSKAFPLLYFKDLAKRSEPELFSDNSADYFVNRAIEKITSMQLANGGFRYWPSGSSRESEYGGLYASHFLIEAKKAGYLVNEAVFARIIHRLKEHAAQSKGTGQEWEIRNRLQRRVYALYLLAMMGEAEMGSMRYLKDNELQALSLESRYRLAAAFALSGDKKTAHSLLPRKTPSVSMKRETGGNFNSSIKAKAIMLAMLAETSPRSAAIPILIEALGNSLKKGRYYTTIENALALYALGKVYKNAPEPNFTGTLEASIFSSRDFDDTGISLSDSDFEGKKVEIEIDGEGVAYYYWQIEGVKESGDIKEYDVDVEVRRNYLDRNGQKKSLDDFKQGELVIAEITLHAPTERIDNLIISDVLPAGLEIENPRLESRTTLDWLDKATHGKRKLHPQYMDIRDDRLNLYASISEKKHYVFHYALRAVTAGSFSLPAIKAEAMYDPVTASYASSGHIEISR